MQASPIISKQFLRESFLFQKTWIYLLLQVGWGCSYQAVKYEPSNEKTVWKSIKDVSKNIWARAWQNQQNDVHPAKTQISLGICPAWSEFTVHFMGS